MKYVVLLYDGMADCPVAELNNKTPMETARKPLFDAMGRDAEVGMARTIPAGMPLGSDVANLSVLGYDPARYYTGRSPIEAVSIGVPVGPGDLTMRCNLVTLSDNAPFESKTMLDYSGGEISTPEAAQLIAAVQEALGSDEFTFYAGVQYRHCLLWKNAAARINELGTLTPPHDILDRPIANHLPPPMLLEIVKESHTILDRHSINIARRAAGKRPANSIWLWGEGTKPALPDFYGLHGLKGSIISAVDLLKGIGILAGMRAPHVVGATGWLDTDYEGKARCAVEELRSGCDFVYLHFEATDEAGHRGDLAGKIRGIELIDERVLPTLLGYLEQEDDYALMILPDHPTPLCVKTHTGGMVPYMIFRKSWRGSGRGVDSVSEATAAATGNVVEYGPDLIAKFIHP